MMEGPVGATDEGAGDAVPEPADAGRSRVVPDVDWVVPDVDWAARAAAAERAVVRRHLRRLAGVVPGTRIGRIREQAPQVHTFRSPPD